MANERQGDGRDCERGR